MTDVIFIPAAKKAALATAKSCPSCTSTQIQLLSYDSTRAYWKCRNCSCKWDKRILG